MIDPAHEVRYQMLRPAQIVARRTECAIAYVPLGNLEWHGVQNPLGADTLQAEGLAILAAQRGGGIAFPPVWYAEPKRECMEYAAADRAEIAERMGLAPEDFAETTLPLGAAESALHYQQLLVNMLQQMESLGFRVGVLIAGHYPLIAHATIAMHRFVAEARYRRRPRERAMVAWACQEPDLRFLLERVHAGDHGGRWETSNCMALHPQTVDLALTRDRTIVGAGKDAVDSSADFGRKNLSDAAGLIAKEALHRLKRPGWYQGASYVPGVGKWRDDPEA